MKQIDWDSVIDGIQAALIWFVITVVTLCTATLILFDVLAGTGVDYFLTRENLFVSVIISMATTGLLMALMFVGYNLIEKKNASRNSKSIGWVILIFSFGVFCLDVIFDSLSADILSFGMIVNLANQPNASVHWMFRALLAGISVVGEALAIAIIMGMPVLKGIVRNALPISYQSTQRNQTRPINQYRNDISNNPLYANIPKKAG